MPDEVPTLFRTETLITISIFTLVAGVVGAAFHCAGSPVSTPPPPSEEHCERRLRTRSPAGPGAGPGAGRGAPTPTRSSGGGRQQDLPPGDTEGACGQQRHHGGGPGVSSSPCWVRPARQDHSDLHDRSGLLSPTTGSITLAGTDVAALSKRELTAFRAERVGFVFQARTSCPSSPPARTCCTFRRCRSGSAARRPMRRSVARRTRTGPHGPRTCLSNSPAASASGGHRAGLMNDPDLILVDEPTAALDTKLGRQVVELLAREIKQRVRPASWSPTICAWSSTPTGCSRSRRSPDARGAAERSGALRAAGGPHFWAGCAVAGSVRRRRNIDGPVAPISARVPVRRRGHHGEPSELRADAPFASPPRPPGSPCTT